MTIAAQLAHEADFEGFRAQARILCARCVEPQEIAWRVAGAGNLFGAQAQPAPPQEGETPGAVYAPREFVDLARFAICHSEPARFELIYRILLRLRDTRKLLEIASDPDVIALRELSRAVSRDRHKMTAFVRFREVGEPPDTRFAAFFEPTYFIEELTAAFFVDRYASMDFTIVTPRRTIDWSNRRLTFAPGGARADVPEEDGFSEAWNLYYRSIFNPARLMTKAMLKEMPKKYWANMPETRQIPGLIHAAESRVSNFIEAPAQSPPPRHDRLAARRAANVFAPGTGAAPAASIASLRVQAKICQRCGLHANATQTVFGEGPEQARIIFVGEQPGDREDILGRPFVGPAGAVFDEGLAQAGIERSQCYITNAVKHFKSEPRGKRRIHKTPNASEAEKCKWWLTRELELVQAPLIVTLGATALHAVAGGKEKLGSWRGELRTLGDGKRLFATIHPSYLLRIPDARQASEERARFFAEMREAARLTA